MAATSEKGWFTHARSQKNARAAGSRLRDRARELAAPAVPGGRNGSGGRVVSRAAMPHISATLTEKTIKLTGAEGLRPAG